MAEKCCLRLKRTDISFEHMPSGIDTMTIFVHQPEFEGKEQAVISAIHRLAKPDSIELEGDLALIAVVGRGMKSNQRNGRTYLLSTGTCKHQCQDDRSGIYLSLTLLSV